MPRNPQRRSNSIRWTSRLVAAALSAGCIGTRLEAQDGGLLHGGHHRVTVQVPATDEITVFDPRVSSDGKPTPIVYTGADGEQRVDIPPAVVVHNYYYTGDRDFRGPRLPGGPSIVVVSHPDTGERHYLDVQMLPGSPRVFYRRNSIEYDFGHRRIQITFGNPLHCIASEVVRVSYVHGRPGALEARADRVRHGGPVVRWIDRTGLPHATHHILHSAHAAADNTADVIHRVGERVTTPVVALIEATPLGSLGERNLEERAIRGRDRAVERAARVAAKNDVTIPTNR